MSHQSANRNHHPTGGLAVSYTHLYYDLRQADRPVDAFSDQVATISRQDVSHQTLLDKAAAQGFRLDQ